MQWLSSETVAVLLSIAYVVLAARQNPWCWLCAALSTGLFMVIFWQVTLPFQSVLNGYYLLMAAVGWWQWQRAQGASEQGMAVQTWPVVRHVMAVVVILLASTAIHFFASHWFASQWVGFDAAIALSSAYTTYLVTQKVLENWLFWVVINTAAAGLYFAHDLQQTAILHLIYVIMSIYGYQQWRRSSKPAVVSVVSEHSPGGLHD